MNHTSLVQLKIRASQFMQEYQKQQTQRQYHKQKLKQNIMLQILSNRNKSQISQSQSQYRGNSKVQTFTRQQINKIASKNRGNAPYSQQRQINNYPLSKSIANKSQALSIAENENISHNIGAEITFKADQKNRNSYILVQGQSQSQYSEHDNSHEQNQQSLINSQHYNQYDTVKDTKNQQQMTFRQKNQSNLNRQSQMQQRQTQRPQKFKFNQPEIQPESQNQSAQDQQRQLQISYNSNKVKQQSPLHQVDEEVEGVVDNEEEYQNNNNHGVFLTMDEEQSMDVTQQIQPKNYSFDIVMDKSEPIENMEDLRKKKIQQLEKKRQIRIAQQKQQKKPDIPVHNKQTRVSGYSQKKNQNKSYTKISDDPQPEPTYSVLRPRPKQSEKKTNLSNNNSIQQSYYGMKSSVGVPLHRGSYVGGVQRAQELSHQDIRTPKSIASQARNSKSRGKNTIFRQSPRRTEKSQGKYSQQPKIQPKERKNTFIKQSNRKLMINAITNVCLPGEINRKQREKLIAAIDTDTSEFFVFLFKDFSRKVIKAIYVLDYAQNILHKIYGDKAPEQIIAEHVKTFYRFDSGSREFKKLDSIKSFSLVVHAVDLR